MYNVAKMMRKMINLWRTAGYYAGMWASEIDWKG